MHNKLKTGIFANMLHRQRHVVKIFDSAINKN